MTKIDRRSFIKAGAASTAAWGFTAASWSRVLGANDDIRAAVVGLNGRGQDHVGGLSRVPGVRIAALCDVDKSVLERSANRLKGKDQNAAVETYLDIRKLLENKNIDVISIATPNHWHSLGAIWAIQAGKDVYLEKPISHNVSEGRRVVEFARKHNRIVQAGTQSRSSLTGITEAVAWVKSGKLGKINVSRALCYKRRDSIGKVTGEQPIPPEIDYDLWCGPALKLPLMRKRLHYDWHWVWNTGNGDLGNQGIHEMDVARWFLGEMALAPHVFSVGGRVGYVDDGETPNTQIILQEYPKALLIFEVRGLPAKTGAREMDRYKGASIGNVVECEGGYVTVPNYTSAAAFDKDGKKIQEWKGEESHYANFIKAVRSRKVSDLNADVLEGHLSSALCHTGNISYFLGKQGSPDEIKAKIKSEKGVEEAYGRMLEHLAANGVDVAKEKLTLGIPLKMDPKKERFIGNDKANALLTRPYRPGFVVPEKA
jgi:predicted dehydrogenase